MNWKIIKWPFIIILFAGLVFGSYHLVKDWRFDTDAPEASFPVPANLAEARRQDVEHLALFFDYERSWTAQSLAAARSEYESLGQKAESLSNAGFELAVARVVALADNAHSKVREYSRTARYGRLPVRGHWFDDGYHVVRAFKGYESLLGHKWIAVEGTPMSEVFSTLSKYIAGPEGTLRKYTPYLIESPELMHAAGITATPERMEVTLADPSVGLGAEVRTVVFAPPYPSSDEQIARSQYLLTSKVYAKSQPDWSALGGSVESTPPYLDFPENQMQMKRLPELEASYLQFWTNSNVGSTLINEFCEESLEAYRRNPSRHLIVDQRFNGGGNFNLTQDCMEAFGQSVPGDGYLYIIIGGTTFSAGMYSAAFLKQSAGEQAVLVGEPVGDTLNHWGEDNLLRLPNSEIEIKFSTGMHDFTQPCRDWKRCHWDALFVDLVIDDLDPDIAAPLMFNDYINTIDPAFAAIEQHMDEH